MKELIQVLFVCLGNICRSPMAEAILRDKVSQRGFSDRINIDSAGTGDWHIGKPPHAGTLQQLQLHNISVQGLKARQTSSEDLNRFDYLICMDDSNERNLRKLAGGHDADIIKFMDLLPDEEVREVPDPYFTGNFDEVYRLINAGCDILLDKIVHEKL